jgi:hypothetical protein
MRTILATAVLVLIFSLNGDSVAMAGNAQEAKHTDALAQAAGESDNRYITVFLRSFRMPDWLEFKVIREAGNRMSLGYRTKEYKIDEKLRPYYPSGFNKVVGPDTDGFLVGISVAPHYSLPMTRNSNRYTERVEQRPYWNLRTYGFELKDGCLVVGIEAGKAADTKLLGRVEHNIATVIETID